MEERRGKLRAKFRHGLGEQVRCALLFVLPDQGNALPGRL